MELHYCKYCEQITNHQVFANGQKQCLKCGKGNKKNSEIAPKGNGK